MPVLSIGEVLKCERGGYFDRLSNRRLSARSLSLSKCGLRQVVGKHRIAVAELVEACAIYVELFSHRK